MAAFQLIDRQNWKREEYFHHYFTAVPCTYSMTVKLEITRIRQSGFKLYPSLIYCLSRAVNNHEEFRMGINPEGQLGIYESLVPSYTVFHPQSETFSCIWTEYHPDFAAFYQAYQQDIADFGTVEHLEAKPDTPPNSFNISMIPWESFEGFHLDLQKGFQYLAPIFTIGKYEEMDGKYFLPMAVQIHHAVCDGFHVCRLVQDIRSLLEQWPAVTSL